MARRSQRNRKPLYMANYMVIVSSNFFPNDRIDHENETHQPLNRALARQASCIA